MQAITIGQNWIEGIPDLSILALTTTCYTTIILKLKVKKIDLASFITVNGLQGGYYNRPDKR